MMYEHIKPYITDKESKAVARYIKSGRYLTESVYTEKLEQELAKFLGVAYVSMVPNGTSALYLSLLASGIGPGDKVFVSDYTMIATANAVKMTGAEPVFVDIDPINLCLDITKVKGKAKALIYASLNGRSDHMRAIERFCAEHNLIFIEDACQSFGSEYDGWKLGTFGRFGCFSLGFHKIITTGQGGFIVSHTKKDYEAIERLKDFGRLKGGNDKHDYLGFNFKFTDLQAVIGLEQLKTIKWRMKKKRQLYEWFWENTPPKGYVPWFLEIMVEQRKKVQDKLLKKGIHTRAFYPPIHTQKIYRQANKYPVATEVCRIGLWLPSSLHLEERDIVKIKKEVYAII